MKVGLLVLCTVLLRERPKLSGDQRQHGLKVLPIVHNAPLARISTVADVWRALLSQGHLGSSAFCTRWPHHRGFELSLSRPGRIEPRRWAEFLLLSTQGYHQSRSRTVPPASEWSRFRTAGSQRRTCEPAENPPSKVAAPKRFPFTPTQRQMRDGGDAGVDLAHTTKFSLVQGSRPLPGAGKTICLSP